MSIQYVKIAKNIYYINYLLKQNPIIIMFSNFAPVTSRPLLAALLKPRNFPRTKNRADRAIINCR